MESNKIEIIWTQPALNRLDEIYEYLAQIAKSVGPAIRVTDSIFDRTNQLKSFPESGSKEPLLQRIGQDSRYLVEGNYKIIYEYHPIHQMVIITDVFDTRQEPEKIERRPES
ncbi:MAG: type II toxin-antitoxin system RelE/ParE family toxin [Cyclobacteriaceae bacterium]